jgi:DNA polymerase I-like protein with 3'-5' exonuclease and polymerase domains
LGKAKKGVKHLKYSIVGDKLRELFFNLYPGLMERIVREQEFALKNGYVRTWTGPVRHFPELRYMKFTSKGNLVGADAILSAKNFASIKNKACNTSIQTAEVYWAMPNATAFNHYMEEWELKSRIFNYTHDSYEIYCYKPELEIVLGLLKSLVDINRQPYYGIPMDMSVTISDLSKGDYLKKGEEISLSKCKLPPEYIDRFDPSIIPLYGKVE